MEPVPVVKKQTYTWLWVVLAVAIVLIAMWLFGVFDMGTGTAPRTPGANLSPLLDAPAATLAQLFA